MMIFQILQILSTNNKTNKIKNLNFLLQHFKNKYSFGGGSGANSYDDENSRFSFGNFLYIIFFFSK